MARYSGSEVGDLQYSKYGVGVYGSGDVPDLRLSLFEALPVDALRSYIDGLGNAVYGQATVFWEFRSRVNPRLKLLRSTKGRPSSHDDPFSAVVAASHLTQDLAAIVRETDGWTTITTPVMNYLRPGDTVTFEGVESVSGAPVIDGTWLVSAIINPATFAVRQTWNGLATFTSSVGTGTVTTTDGIQRIPAGQGWVSTPVTPGVEYYYALYAEDPTVPGLWLEVGSQTFLAPADHGSVELMVSTLPAFMTNANHGTATLPSYDVLRDTDPDLAPGDPSLLKYVAGLAWVWDQILTRVDKLRRLRDPASIPSAFVPAACETLGIAREPAFGEQAERAMLRAAPTINALRGTKEGLTAYVESLTGLSTDVTYGKNLMLTTENASFEQGTGHWLGENADLGTVTSPAVPTPAGTFFALEDTDGGAAALRLARSFADLTPIAVEFGRGVRNDSVYRSGKHLVVTTLRSHGLEAGDQVRVVDATTGFNLSGTVTKATSATRYALLATGTLPSGAALTAGNTVRLTAGANPFAVLQGIPVTEGAEYRLSYHAAVVADQSFSAGTTSADISWWDGAGKLLSTASAVSGAAVTSSLGQKVGEALTAPLGAVYATTRVTFERGDATRAAGDSFALDGVMFALSSADTAYEEARVITLAMSAPAGTLVGSVAATRREVIRKRLLANLQNEVPIGAAYRMTINSTLIEAPA